MTRIPTDPDELAALAGEYVLGTLDARDSAAVERGMETNGELRARVAEWEAWLSPLLALAQPEAPPLDLWSRIEQHISPPQSRSKSVRPRFQRLWQGWAIGATLAAAALAAVTLLPKPPQERIMTVLVSDRTQTAWTAEVDPRGALKLASLPAPAGGTVDTAPAGDKVLQMWALPAGATAPVSLGLIPRGSESVTIPTPAIRPVSGMLILISLEPPGGAPGASPTGPVLFLGRLTAAGSS